MSEFRTHVRTGLAVHVCLTAGASVAYLASSLGEVGLLAVAGSLPVTLAGAVFPDLDHHASIPSRLVRRHGPRVVAAGLLLAMYADRRLVVMACAAIPVVAAPEYLAGLVSAGVAAVGYHGADRLIPFLRPRHRGPTHRIPVAIVASGAIGVWALVVSVALSVPPPAPRIGGAVAAGSFLAGVLSHLHQDELLEKWETYVSVR
jgi:membrane-bound metal-dependent hydrolase YbcI (DUF457 family)